MQGVTFATENTKIWQSIRYSKLNWINVCSGHVVVYIIYILISETVRLREDLTFAFKDEKQNNYHNYTAKSTNH